MSAPDTAPAPVPAPVISTATTLRRLYLTLFLRGRSSRGLKREQAPKSIASKLLFALLGYGLFGFIALFFAGEGIFTLSLYLHGSTMVFLGMFIASSAGEILFNQQEAEILLHRPVEPRTLLRAKISVLAQVSLWLALAFNLAGLIGGTLNPRGSLLFLPAHLLSTCVSALFCCGGVVLAYQLCLRWFGRERLDNLMTTMQVIMAVGLMVAGQIVPQLIRFMGPVHGINQASWWFVLLPPAWFAGLDTVLTGGGGLLSGVLAAIGVAVTAGVLTLAFGKLAGTYQTGLQTLSETGPRKPASAGGGVRHGLLGRLIALPPLSWLLRDPITRASFRLTAAYMVRDRDLKLRLYPGLAPILVMPAIFLIQGLQNHDGGFGIALAGGYLGLIPLLSLNLIQVSQNWQAGDIFRLAPTAGPAPFIHGAIRAVGTVLVLPALVILLLLVFLLPGNPARALLLLPGIIALPAYALASGAFDQVVPLSRPTEEAKSASRGLKMMLVISSAMAISGASLVARQYGVFGWYLAGEALVIAAVSFGLHAAISRTRWTPLE